jgi:hypothetical protein
MVRPGGGARYRLTLPNLSFTPTWRLYFAPILTLEISE